MTATPRRNRARTISSNSRKSTNRHCPRTWRLLDRCSSSDRQASMRSIAAKCCSRVSTPGALDSGRWAGPGYEGSRRPSRSCIIQRNPFGALYCTPTKLRHPERRGSKNHPLSMVSGTPWCRATRGPRRCRFVRGNWWSAWTRKLTKVSDELEFFYQLAQERYNGPKFWDQCVCSVQTLNLANSKDSTFNVRSVNLQLIIKSAIDTIGKVIPNFYPPQVK